MKKTLTFAPILALCLLAVLQCGNEDQTTNASLPTGACCDQATGGCAITTQAACAFDWLGEDLPCGPGTCAPPGPITYLRADHHGCLGADGKLDDAASCAFLKASAYDGSNLALTIHFDANCCPDFLSAVTVTDRVIEIALADTLNGCRCVCPYEDDFVFSCPTTGDLQVRFRLVDDTCAFDTLITVQR